MRCVVSGLLLMLCVSAQAGKLQKAFEALHIYNYFEAKRLFEKALKKDTVGGGYGLSVIYSRNDNPFYQPDSSLKYILWADNSFQNLNEKKKAKLFEVGIDQGEIIDQKQRVSDLFFQRALDSMTTAEFNEFIDVHPWYNNLPRAIHIRDSLAFEDAKSVNTWRSFKSFLNKYPDAIQIPLAKKHYHRLFYLDHTQSGSLTDYEEFVKNHPNSPYFREAQDRIFELSTQQNTTDSYHNFIANYPNNPNVEEAWKTLYMMSVKRNTPLEIANFILEYPDYPYRNDALQDYNLSTAKFYPFKRGSKWGFIDTAGEVKIEPEYDWVEPFSEGSALVGKGDYAGYINKRGEINVPIKYDDGGTFKEGYAWVEKDGKYGLVNNHGQLVLNLLFNDMGTFNEGFVYAQKDDVYGFFNRNLELIIPFKYNQVFPFNMGYAIVDSGGKKGVIDYKGNTLFRCKYQKIVLIEKDSFWLVENDTAKGLYNLQGELVLPEAFDEILHFSENRIMVVKKEKYGYVNNSGDTIIPVQMDYNSNARIYGGFKNGVAQNSFQGKVGLIDTLGKKVFPRIFKAIGEFNRLTAVRKNGLWGYADQHVKLKIRYQYDVAKPFENGLAVVSKEGKYGLINVEGEVLLNYDFEDLASLRDSLFMAKRNDKWGIIRMDGTWVLEADLDKIEEVEPDIFKLYRNGFMAYFHLRKDKMFYEEQGF